MTAIDEIKARIDAVELIGETVKLRRTGRNYIGFCPFHPNTRTPAFVVFPESGTWRCFGACNEGGDIFKFLMKKEGWDFAETLRYLAERAGVPLEAPNPQRKAEDEEHERLRRLLEEAVTFFRYHLTQTPAGKPALDYLQKRGVQPGTLETFGLGYAPDSWDAALAHFTTKGWTTADLIQTGLVTERQDASGVYDRFRNRIMFPIRDGMGRMAGFGARILDPNDIPKFLNSPQTALFDKGGLLYGLDLARKPIRAADQAVIVEGYLDVILLHQAGYTNTVSPMGTALTETQFRLLKRFTRRIILALDADAAGEKATLRGLEVARQSLDHAEELTFDARGLLRHEARLQADVRVTTIPEGKDPDEVVLESPEEWGQILANAKPIVIHVMETLAAQQDVEDPKTKSAIAARVMPLIEDVPSPVERDAYRQRLARLLKVDERALVAGGAPASGTGRRRPNLPANRTAGRTPVAEASPARRMHAQEEHCLRLLLHRPEVIYQIDRALQKEQLNRLNLADFSDSDHQAMARLILSSLTQEEDEPGHYIRENLPDELEELYGKLTAPVVLPSQLDTPRGGAANALAEDLLHTLMSLRLARINEEMKQLRFLQEEIQQPGSDVINPYEDLILQSLMMRKLLDEALSHPIQFD